VHQCIKGSTVSHKLCDGIQHNGISICKKLKWTVNNVCEREWKWTSLLLNSLKIYLIYYAAPVHSLCITYIYIKLKQAESCGVQLPWNRSFRTYSHVRWHHRNYTSFKCMLVPLSPISCGLKSISNPKHNIKCTKYISCCWSKKYGWPQPLLSAPPRSHCFKSSCLYVETQWRVEHHFSSLGTCTAVGQYMRCGSHATKMFTCQVYEGNEKLESGDLGQQAWHPSEQYVKLWVYI